MSAPSEVRAREILKRLGSHHPVIGAEVGVYKGALSMKLLRRNPRLTLLMVDNWASRQERPASYRETGDKHATRPDREMKEAMANAIRGTAFAQNRRLIKRADSVEAAATVQDASLDFVFIDAEHSYEACTRDIAAWLPKLKPGGLLSGHDYYPPGWPGVVRAVDEFVAKTGLELDLGENYCWFVRLPGHAEPGGMIPPENPTVALVIGGGNTIWDDLKAFEEMIGREWDGLVVACNDIGAHWPRRLDHWCTLHPNKMETWIKARAERGFLPGFMTWGRRTFKVIDRTVQPWAGGSSGLLAITVAYEVGADLVVLCGIPMTDAPHFEESEEHHPEVPWRSSGPHLKAWKKEEVIQRMQGRVKSMSGRTRDLLGAPTIEWLRGTHGNEENT